MRTIRLALIVVVAASASLQAGATPAPRVFALPEGSASLLARGEAVRLALPGEALELRARPNPMLATGVRPVHIGAGGRAPQPLPPMTTYVGEVAGRSDLVVRLAIDHEVEGLILSESGGWLLSPAGDGGATAAPLAALHHEAVGPDGVWPNGSPHAVSVGEPAGGAAARLKLRLAWEGDFNFYNSNQTAWSTTLLETANYTEGIYDRQLDIDFEVSYIGAWTVPDPYPSRYACGGPAGQTSKLEQFRDYWQTHRQGVVRDTAHLAAGAAFNGNIIGCAYIASLANDYAYGVNRIRHGSTSLYDNVNLFAHELGHNFNGLHERSAGFYGATGSSTFVPGYTIMNPVAQLGVLAFSQLKGVRSPNTGWELDNQGAMRGYASSRLLPA